MKNPRQRLDSDTEDPKLKIQMMTPNMQTIEGFVAVTQEPATGANERRKEKENIVVAPQEPTT